MYIYSYNDYSNVKTYLIQSKFKKYNSNDYKEKYIYNYLNNRIDADLYVGDRLLVIRGDKDSIDKTLKGLSLFNKVNLNDKNLFCMLYEKNFFKNLCEVTLKLSEDESGIESVTYKGHRIMESGILEQFDFFDENSLTELLTYKIQPYNQEYLMRISEVNFIEVNSNCIDDKIEQLIDLLIMCLDNYF